MGVSAAECLALLQALLPSGAAWPREAGATLTRLLAAWADELVREHGRAEGLLQESDPRSALELLADWERVAGLPDACSDDAPTIQQRRAAVTGRVVGTGDQSRAYYLALAAGFGYPDAELVEFFPFRAGFSAAGEAVANLDEWRHVWQLNGPGVSPWRFAAGAGAAGDPLRTPGNALLYCEFLRRKPAHTTLLFDEV